MKGFSRSLKVRLIAGSLLRVVAFTGLWIGIAVLIETRFVRGIVFRGLRSMWGDFFVELVPVLEALYVLVYIVVVLVLIYLPAVKAVNYVDILVGSINTLFRDDDTYVRLPADLRGVESQLNNLKHTALKNAEVAAQAEKRKNDLVVYLAHDIRTPLTSIIGYLNLLDEAPDLPSEQKAKYVGISLEKAYRLEELVNEFFEITRFNLQTIVLHKTEINLAFMLEQLADEFYPLLAPQEKRAVVEVDADLTLYCDADKMSRVFNNVLKNAVVYSERNSTIRIAAAREGESVVVTFANRGSAIPAETLNMIFEKFYRLDASRSSQTGGAGLGLAIAKEIVVAHGGTITAHSGEQETVFTITLPAARHQT